MCALFYTQHQWQVFSRDLHQTFLKAGFELVEEPHIYYPLYGFRATYIRRLLMHKPTILTHNISSTLIQVVGLPFGVEQARKMIVVSSPRTLSNDPVSETLKLRINFDDQGNASICNSDQQQQQQQQAGSCSEQTVSREPANPQSKLSQANQLFLAKLTEYVARIGEVIAPKIDQLPIEMKLEILKKMNVYSIIRMSQVNNEFRALIFKYGEPLWKHLCVRDFNLTTINRLRHQSWMELYREHYILEQIEICRKERALPGLPERPALPPAPLLLQIEWFPEALEVPYYNHNINMFGDVPPFAMEWPRMRRADSLDSLH